MHCVVKGDCFAFAIRISGVLNLLGRFPFRGESVGNCPEIADPIVDQRKRQILVLLFRGGSQDWADPGHLPIVGGGIDADIVGLGESGEAGETKEG